MPNEIITGLPEGDMRSMFGRTLADLAKENPNLVGVMPDIGIFVFDRFREEFGGRSINVGISEANAISIAAGIADETGGPAIVYGIDPFVTLRALEPFKVSVCDQNLNVKLVGSGAGLSYSQLGSTHHSTENLGALRALPNLRILCPADMLETRKAIEAAVRNPGPFYVRISRDEPVFTDQTKPFDIGKAYLLREGRDATIIGSGAILYHALEASSILKEKKGLEVGVLNMHTLKPLDVESIYDCARRTGNVFTLEEHSVIGGLGEGVGTVLAESGIQGYRFRRIGVEDKFCKNFGKHNDLRRNVRIASPCVANIIAGTLYSDKPQYFGERLCGVCVDCKSG